MPGISPPVDSPMLYPTTRIFEVLSAILLEAKLAQLLRSESGVALKLIRSIPKSLETELFITSVANVKPMVNDNKLFKLDDVTDVGVFVKKAKGDKCSRCWKILSTPCKRNNCGLKN